MVNRQGLRMPSAKLETRAGDDPTLTFRILPKRLVGTRAKARFMLPSPEPR